MRLNQLEYLVAVKKRGTISKAAQHLYVAQPSLSAGLKELEEEIGFELLRRSNKGVTLTPLGEMAVERAEEILQKIDEIKNLDTLAAGSLRGRILVGCVPFICESVFLDVMVALKEQHPELLIHLQENDSLSVLHQAALQEIDLGLMIVCNSEEEAYFHEMEKNHVVFCELFQDEMCFWVGAKHPLRDRQTVKMAEILQYPYIANKGTLNLYDKRLFGQFINLDQLSVIQMTDRDSVKRYITKSQATVAMPLTMAQDPLYEEVGLWHPLKIADYQWTAKVGLVYHQSHFITKEEQVLITRIKDKIEQLLR